MDVNLYSGMGQMTQMRKMDGSGQGQGGQMRDIMQNLSVEDRGVLRDKMQTMTEDEKTIAKEKMMQVDPASLSSAEFLQSLLSSIENTTNPIESLYA